MYYQLSLELHAFNSTKKLILCGFFTGCLLSVGIAKWHRVSWHAHAQPQAVLPTLESQFELGDHTTIAFAICMVLALFTRLCKRPCGGSLWPPGRGALAPLIGLPHCLISVGGAQVCPQEGASAFDSRYITLQGCHRALVWTLNADCSIRRSDTTDLFGQSFDFDCFSN